MRIFLLHWSAGSSCAWNNNQTWDNSGDWQCWGNGCSLQGNDQFTVAPIIRSTFLHAWKVNQPNFAWCFVATSQEPSVSYISASCLWKACFDKLHKCSCVYIADWDVTGWCHDWVFLLLLEMCWKPRTQILVSIFSSKFLVHYMVNYIQFQELMKSAGRNDS